MPVVLTTPYLPPVDQLLTLGDCRRPGWPHYGAMGFGAEHVPELIRMAADSELTGAESDDADIWAPIHAWRVLGMLRAPEAVEPLLALFAELDGWDWPSEELPEVFGLIGAPAIPALTAYLADRSRDVFDRASVARALKEVARQYPDTREEVVALLVRELEDVRDDDGEDEDELAGFLVGRLIDLKAVEAAPAIERAFTEDRVELSIVGDWEDVQVELGLLAERITPRPRYFFPFTRGFQAAPQVAPPAAQARALRKRQKEASRKKRRRKR